MSISTSQTQYGKNEPFELQVSRGQIPNHQTIFRSAYSASIINGAEYAVWPRAGAYVFPTVASVMTLSSSVVGDVGQLVRIVGLDANYIEISEILALNGRTAVNSTKVYFRINDMQVLTDTPTGNIYFGTGTLTLGVPANIYGFIAALDGTQLAAIYTVPAGHELYIYGGSSNATLANANKTVTISFNTIINGVDYRGTRIQTANGYQHFPYSPPLRVPEKADLLDTASTTDASAPSSVTVNLSGILIQTSAGY